MMTVYLVVMAFPQADMCCILTGSFETPMAGKEPACPQRSNPCCHSRSGHDGVSPISNFSISIPRHLLVGGIGLLDDRHGTGRVAAPLGVISELSYTIPLYPL